MILTRKRVRTRPFRLIQSWEYHYSLDPSSSTMLYDPKPAVVDSNKLDSPKVLINRRRRDFSSFWTGTISIDIIISFPFLPCWYGIRIDDIVEHKRQSLATLTRKNQVKRLMESQPRSPLNDIVYGSVRLACHLWLCIIR